MAHWTAESVSPRLARRSSATRGAPRRPSRGSGGSPRSRGADRGTARAAGRSGWPRVPATMPGHRAGAGAEAPAATPRAPQLGRVGGERGAALLAGPHDPAAAPHQATELPRAAARAGALAARTRPAAHLASPSVHRFALPIRPMRPMAEGRCFIGAVKDSRVCEFVGVRTGRRVVARPAGAAVAVDVGRARVPAARLRVRCSKP